MHRAPGADRIDPAAAGNEELFTLLPSPRSSKKTAALEPPSQIFKSERAGILPYLGVEGNRAA